MPSNSPISSIVGHRRSARSFGWPTSTTDLGIFVTFAEFEREPTVKRSTGNSARRTE